MGEEFGCNDWSENAGSESWVKDIYSLCEQYHIHPAYFTYRSFSEGEPNAYSFALSSIHYRTDGSGETKEILNEKLRIVISDALKQLDFE